MDLSFIDSTLNVCRSFFDVLHICFYLAIAVIASLIAYYKYDNISFDEKIYKPYSKILLAWKKSISVNYLNLKFIVAFIIWNPSSNRNPYFDKILKFIFKKMFR